MTWRTGGGSEDMLLTKLREFGYAVVRGLCPLSLVQGATRCVVDRAMHALQLKGVPPGENMEGMLQATWTTSKDMAGWHLSRNLPFGNAFWQCNPSAARLRYNDNLHEGLAVFKLVSQ